MEKLCNEGHVIDNGRETCSRCGGRAVNEVKTEPEVLFDGETSSEVEKKSEEVSSEAQALSDAKEAVIDENTGAPEGAEVISREEATEAGIDVEKAEAEAQAVEA